MTTEDETPIVANRRDGLGSETMVDMDGSASGIAAHARALAERGLHAQAAGDAEEADRLLSEAQRLDPDAVAIVLNDAAVAPDARDTTTADRDAGRVRRHESDVAAAAYPGSTG